jgi:hypothetical protein
MGSSARAEIARNAYALRLTTTKPPARLRLVRDTIDRVHAPAVDKDPDTKIDER